MQILNSIIFAKLQASIFYFIIDDIDNINITHIICHDILQIFLLKNTKLIYIEINL